MKKAAMLGVLLTLIAFLIPALAVPVTEGSAIPVKPQPAPPEEMPEEPKAEASEPPKEEAPPEEVRESKDSGRMIRLKTEQGINEITLRDYLVGVVAAEMPVSFSPEALKAQAVTARTYTLYRAERQTAHDDADVCSDYTHCSAWLSETELRNRWGGDFENNLAKIRNAVDETDSLVVEYEGELIDAVFHSTSSGRTEAAVDVWGSERPYLQSVQSPGEEQSARYYGSVEYTVDELRAKLSAAFPGAELSGSASAWFYDTERSAAGGVTALTVGGVRVKGSELRAALGLNSSNFSISPMENTVIITTVGYGHGVGMSQYGAEAMAQSGSGFAEILTHYYTGTEVKEYGGITY